MYNRILIPLDGGPCSDYTVEHGANLAKLCGAELVFLYVKTPPSAVETASHRETHEELEQKAMGALERSLQQARAGGVAAQKTIVEASQPAEAILEAEKDFDLIVIGTHGRHGADRVILGSVSEAVLRRSQKPHLVLRCPADEAFDLIDYYRKVETHEEE